MVFVINLVLALKKLGRKDWKPWIASFMAELACYYAHTNEQASRQTTKLEKQELSSRKYLLLYYLLKKPVFDLTTKSYLESIIAYTSPKFLLSIIGTFLKDYLPLWEDYHFYTTGF